MLINLSVNISTKLIHLLEVNAKKETLVYNKDGRSFRFKKIEEPPSSETNRLDKQDKDFMAIFTH